MKSTKWGIMIFTVAFTACTFEEPEDTTDQTTTNIQINVGDTVTHNGVEYGVIESPITGKLWLDRNLGASQVCTSITDSECFGDYYQWGRATDGHEKNDSGVVTTTLATDVNSVGHGNYIWNSDSYDWASVDSDGSIRSNNWASTNGSSICPNGFKVPSKEEWESEYNSIANTSEAFTKLKLPASGGLGGDQKSIMYSDYGFYWSSSFENSKVWRVGFGPSDKYLDEFPYLNVGKNVRCIVAN
jgi:uncharacterized protein (TIGR02145 family)